MGQSALEAITGPASVGKPGVAVLLLGFLLLAAAMAFMWWRIRDHAEPRGKALRAPTMRGFTLQAIGFAAVAFGPVKITLQSASAAALGQAVTVAILMGFCLCLFATSVFALKKNWSFSARTRSDHDLVTWGPFATIRHPIYTGLFAALLAIAVALGHWRGFLLALPLFWYGTWLRAVAEESVLRGRFGDDYERYAARVKRFVPGVF